MPTPRKSPSGRKPIINSELVTELENYLMSGVSQKDACIMVGISPDTFYTWIQISDALMAEEEHPNMPKPPQRFEGEGKRAFKVREAQYEAQITLLAEFSDTIKRARAYARTAAATTLHDAAMTDWKAAATFLERSDPENWAKRSGGMNPDGSHSHKIILEIVNEDAGEDE